MNPLGSLVSPLLTALATQRSLAIVGMPTGGRVLFQPAGQRTQDVTGTGAGSKFGEWAVVLPTGAYDWGSLYVMDAKGHLRGKDVASNVGRIRWEDLTPMQPVRPSGDALSQGAPSATYPAGTYRARTAIQVAWLLPTLNGAAFAASFRSNLPALVPGATAQGASVTAGAPGITRAALPLTVRQRISSILASVIPGAGPLAALAINVVAASPVDVPTMWFTVDVSFTAMQPFSTDNLNRTIARAFAQAVVGWQPGAHSYRALPNTAPADGAPLHAQLRAGDACSGGANWGKSTRAPAPGSSRCPPRLRRWRRSRPPPPRRAPRSDAPSPRAGASW